MRSDLVSFCIGTTYERAVIKAWFDYRERTDPKIGNMLRNKTLKSNLPYR